MPDVTLTTLQSLKLKGEKIAMLTCYDATFAQACCRAGVELHRAAVGGGIGTILGQRPAHRPPALVEVRRQVAAHQPQPIGIARNLVRGIDREVPAWSEYLAA